jgi:hypothetical protein
MTSNPSGVFAGKEAKKNKLVLQSLLYGEKNAKEIALFIKGKEKGHLNTIYSVIDRRGGALDRLRQKMYVVKNQRNGQYALTRKGLLSALAFEDNFDKIFPKLQGYVNQAEPVLKRLFKQFGDAFSEPYAKDMERLAHSRSFFEVLSQETRMLVDSGINIDEMSDGEFYSLMLVKSFRLTVLKNFRSHLSKRHDNSAKKIKSFLDTMLDEGLSDL